MESISKKHKTAEEAKSVKSSSVAAPVLSIDYAPTGRASCKKCQTPIAEQSVRIGRQVRSRFHDGFDTQLLHFRCGAEYAKSIDDFRGWQTSLRWDDIERLMKSFGDEWVEDVQLVNKYKERIFLVNSAAQHLAEVPVGLLRQVFEANDMVVSDRAKSVELASVIADSLLFGRLPTCPVCNTRGLRQEGTDLRCHGWFSASTKCDFSFTLDALLKNTHVDKSLPSYQLMEAKLSRDGVLVVPEDAAQHKAFKTLLVPKELRKELAGLAKKSQASASGGGVSTSVINALDSEDEETVADVSVWMAGLRFVFAGLDHAEIDRLTRMITKHGGAVLEDVVLAGPDRTTHLVISEDELFRDPKSSRYRKCCDAGIPIVKVDFVTAFLDSDRAVDGACSGLTGTPATTATTASSTPSLADNTMVVSGRDKGAKNSIINGSYECHPENVLVADRPVFVKKAVKSIPELFLFFSSSRGKWKIAPSLDDGKGHLAINNDATAERPNLCKQKWEVFAGKELGFEVDDNVVVRAEEKPKTNKRKALASLTPHGPLLRQRKYLKFFVVEGSVGKKLPTIKQCLMSVAGGGGKKSAKRPAPQPGTPLVTVDEEVGAADYRDAQIFVDASNNVYNVLLTKTDAIANVNKFYAIQLIAYSEKGKKLFAVFRKWGRFGYSGNAPMNGSMSVDFGVDKSGAIEAFREKFTECTGIDFDLRDCVDQKPGRYAFVELQGQESGAATTGGDKKKKTTKAPSNHHVTKSSLPTEVAQLIELIFDLEMIEREMRSSMDIDTSRLPPSALSKRQLANGLAVLREIEKILLPHVEEEGKVADSHSFDGASRDLKLKDCASRFYTIVPHCFDRKESVPVIDTIKRLKKVIRNMEDLMQICELEEIRTRSVAKQNTAKDDKSLIDIQYDELGCRIEHLTPSQEEFQIISNAIQKTHATTHDTYSLKVDKIFKIEKPGELEKFQSDPACNKESNLLLWHGSRLSNWAGILKNGLRIAPKDAPVTGYMFGKGVYFADSSSKSANYCFANEEEPDGLLVLCEVALGNPYKRLEAQYEAPSKCKKKGFDSTWGVGQNAPSEKQQLPDGSLLPTGNLINNDAAIELAKIDHPRGKPTLLYNEYIVYRESQFRMKYVVHVKFDFKKNHKK